MLRFYGYFKEAITESNMENFRVRKIVLYYYLEDGSMQVAEPKQDNSGIPQVSPGQRQARNGMQEAAQAVLGRDGRWARGPVTHPALRRRAVCGTLRSKPATAERTCEAGLLTPPPLLSIPSRASSSSATRSTRTTVASSRPLSSAWARR